jgi:hypothetical protein
LEYEARWRSEFLRAREQAALQGEVGQVAEIHGFRRAAAVLKEIWRLAYDGWRGVFVSYLQLAGWLIWVALFVGFLLAILYGLVRFVKWAWIN